MGQNKHSLTTSSVHPPIPNFIKLGWVISGIKHDDPQPPYYAFILCKEHTQQPISSNLAVKQRKGQKH
jgi:hypothetical protein